MYNEFSKGEDIRLITAETNSSFPASSKMEIWNNSERRVYTILERPIRNLFENSNETSFVINHLQKMFNIGDGNFVLSGLELTNNTLGITTYTTLTPGIFVYNENIYSVYPTPYTASRQLEKDLELNSFDGTEYITITYENEKFNATISIGGSDIPVAEATRGIELLYNIKTALEEESISTDGLANLEEYQLEPCFVATSSPQYITFNGTEITAETNSSTFDFGEFTDTTSTKNTSIVWNGLITSSIKDDAITNDKLYEMPAFSIKGNASNVEANPQDIDEDDLIIYFDMVDRSSNQDILGTKTFTSEQRIDNNIPLTFKDLLADTGWVIKNDASNVFKISNNTTPVISIDDSNDISFNETSNLVLNATTESTGTSEGSLVVKGGVGIAKDLFIGEDLSVTRNSTFNNDIRLINDKNLILGTETDGWNFKNSSTGTLSIINASDSKTVIKIENDNKTSVTGEVSIDGKTTITANGTDESINLIGPTNVTGEVLVDGKTTITANGTDESINLIGPTNVTGVTIIDGKTTITANGTDESIDLVGPTKVTGVTIIDGDFNIITESGEVASINNHPIVTLTDTQALINKTYEGLTINTTTGILDIADTKKLTVSDNTTLNTNDITFKSGKKIEAQYASLIVGDIGKNGDVTIKSNDSTEKSLTLNSNIALDGNDKTLTINEGNFTVTSQSTGSSLTLPSTLTIEAMPNEGNVLYVNGANTIDSEPQLNTTRGGTGQSIYTDGELLIGNTVGNTLTKGTITGTSNQIAVANGNGTITLSTPQNIDTSATPQFARIGIGTAADGTANLKLNTGTILSAVGNGTTAKGFTLTTPSYTTTGAKLLSVMNSTAEKFSIDKDGNVTSGSINKVTIATPGTSATLTIADTKTLTVNDDTTVAAGTITLANTKVLDLTNASLTIGDATGTGDIIIKSDDEDQKTLKLDSDIEIDGNGKKLTLNAGNLSITSHSDGSSLTLPSALTIEAMPTDGNVLYVNGEHKIGSEAQLATTRGGTGIGTYTTGDIIYSSNGNTLSRLEIETADKFLRSNGTVPVWSTTTIPDTVAKGSVLAANTENALTAVSNVSGLKVLQANDDVISWNSTTGTGSAVYSTSPTLTTPILGAATATSINKVAITAPSTSATLTIANAKTLTVNNTLTFAGTDSKTMIFPTTNQNIVGETSTQTLTNKTMSTDSIWNGNTVSVAYGGTGTTAFTENAIIVGNGTESIQAPGPTLTSTEFAFGGVGTVKSTGDLTLTPSTKTTTEKPFEITAGGITVTGDSTITGITTLKYDTNNELEVQSLGTIIKGNVGITLHTTNPSFSITNSSNELVLLVDDDSVDVEKKLNTKGGIENIGTITSTENITVGAAETLSTISSGTITTTGTITASAFANSGTYPLNDINVKKFNGNTILNTATSSTSNGTDQILWIADGGTVINRTTFASLPTAKSTDDGDAVNMNGLMPSGSLKRIATLEGLAGLAVEGVDGVNLIGSVNEKGVDVGEGGGGNVTIYGSDISISDSISTTIATRLSDNADDLTRLKGHVPTGTVSSGVNEVMLKNGTSVSWGKITDDQIYSTISNLRPKTTTGTSVENWLPLAFWNSDGNGLLRDHDVVYSQTDDTLTATNVTSRSSRTVKKDIVPFEPSAFDILDQIEVVSFHYINDETQADKVGFIAEDSPELVAGINHDKMEMGNCIGLLIKAVQELKQENKELREIINGHHNT